MYIEAPLTVMIECRFVMPTPEINVTLIAPDEKTTKRIKISHPWENALSVDDTELRLFVRKRPDGELGRAEFVDFTVR